MQLNKNIKNFINYFLGPLLFIWLSYSIFRQIQKQPQLEESWSHIRQSFQSYNIIYLLGALILIFANWGIEAWKWLISVRTFYPIKFIQAFKAVLSGVSFSVTMPNRVGEYLGRIVYLPEGNRLKTISITLVGSFAQLLVTIITGTIGLIILKSKLVDSFPQFRIWYQFALYSLILLALIMLLMYFNVAGLVTVFNRWIKNKKYNYLVEAVQNFHSKLLLQLLLLSLLRYAVFVVQYIFVFYLFQVNIDAAQIAITMSVVFLAMAVVPSIALVEVWLRGELSIKLIGLFSSNSLGIGFTSVTVWFINLILPAIIGSLLLLNLRIFKKNEKH